MINGEEKGPVTTQRTLALGGLRPWGGPWQLPKGVCSGRRGRTGRCCQRSVSLGLIRLTKQIAAGIRFPGSSSFPHHLSCQTLSSEGIRPTVPSVLMLPWLQLHSHQQWGLTSSLQSTELGSANYGPWATSNQPPVFVNKLSLAHSHTHSCMYCLWLLLCCNSRAE